MQTYPDFQAPLPPVQQETFRRCTGWTYIRILLKSKCISYLCFQVGIFEHHSQLIGVQLGGGGGGGGGGIKLPLTRALVGGGGGGGGGGYHTALLVILISSSEWEVYCTALPHWYIYYSNNTIGKLLHDDIMLLWRWMPSCALWTASCTSGR